MTEQEWVTGEYLSGMTAFLRDKISERQARLFAVACCRRIWSLLHNDQSRYAVETTELYADRLVTRRELIDAKSRAQATAHAIAARWTPEGSAAWAAVWTAAGGGAWRRAAETVIVVVARAAGERERQTLSPTEDVDEVYSATFAAENEARRQEEGMLCRLLREIVGNPFHRPSLDPSWLTNTVVGMGQAIYDDRCFDRMPILADALEEAGCTNSEILAHCRGPGPHVRGCWVVDLLLGKE